MRRIRRDALDLEFLPETSDVEFTGPKKVGYFSSYYDKEHKLAYRPDNSSQRYLVTSELKEPIYCLEGFNPETDKCSLQDTWPDFFNWIRSNENIIHGLSSPENSSSSIDFICSNASLKHIMLSLHNRFDWTINAIKIRRAIFLFVSDEDTLKKREMQREIDTFNNKLAYARFTVIKKITKQVEESEPNSNAEMDLLSAVAFSEVGQHRIMHFGVSEFVMSNDDVHKPIDQADFAALKLNKNLLKGHKGVFNIPFYRHMYWWASALLCGVKTLICGDLDEDFTLHKLEVFPSEILQDTASRNISKKQKKCFITLDKILLFIKSQVEESNKFYDVHFNSKSKEVTASLSVSLSEDSVSSKIF